MDTSNTSEQPEIERVCGTCALWTRHFDERMRQHGACDKRPVGYYTHETQACLLTPVQWRTA